MTEFIRRPKEESPFYRAAVRNGWPTAEGYGKKVDEFCLSGVGRVERYTSFTPTGIFEGSPYADLPRSRISGISPSEDGGSGRSATPRAWLFADRDALTNT